jgi:hypothetical protein
MIYGGMNSAKRMRHIEIFADPDRRRILDFTVPRNGGSSLGSGIVVDAVLCSFAKKNATI